MIRLVQFSASPLCGEIRRALRFKQVEFEIFDWPIGELGAVGLEGHSPSGGLPILQIEGAKIRETARIALEIERRFPEPALLPADGEERARVLALENWACQSLHFIGLAARLQPEDAVTTLGRILAGVPEELRASAIQIVTERMQTMVLVHGAGSKSREELAEEIDRLLGVVEELQRRTGFVVGARATLADLAIAAQADEIRRTTIGREILAARAELGSYLGRIDSLAGS